MSHPVGGREYYKDAKLLATLTNGQNVNIPDSPFKALLIRKKATGSLDQLRLHDAVNGGGSVLFQAHNTGSLGSFSGLTEILPVGILNGSNVKSIVFISVGGGEVEVYELF